MPWRFVLTPKWLVGHVVVLAVVTAFVGLGMWQLDRLASRKETNAQIRAAADSPPTRLDSSSARLLRPFHRVVLTGVPDAGRSVYVRYPVLDGRSGFHVLTPVVLGDGTSVILNQGWIERSSGEDDARPAPGSAPLMPVTIEGMVRESQAVRDIRVAATSGDPPVPTVTGVDVDAVARLMNVDKPLPFWVQQTAPAASAEIRPLGPPEITEGPHFAYALQWFSFAAIGIIGWTVLVRRAVR